MREAAKSHQGDLRMLTVSDAGGVRCGWIVYYAIRGGASFVLQIGVRQKDDFKNTLQALFQDAWRQGSSCVKGAAIPQYITTMTEQHCFFRHPYDRVVIHSKNPESQMQSGLGKQLLPGSTESAGYVFPRKTGISKYRRTKNPRNRQMRDLRQGQG